MTKWRKRNEKTDAVRRRTSKRKDIQKEDVDYINKRLQHFPDTKVKLKELKEKNSQETIS